jgi:hypothetical protein
MLTPYLSIKFYERKDVDCNHKEEEEEGNG